MDRPVQHDAWHFDGVDQQQHHPDLAAGDFQRHEGRPALGRRRDLYALDAHGLHRRDGDAFGLAGPAFGYIRARAVI